MEQLLTYDDFIKWKNAKNESAIEHKSRWQKFLHRYKLSEKHFPYRGYTSSQSKFAEYLLRLASSDEKLEQMLTEIGDKRIPFEHVYFFLKEKLRIKIKSDSHG